MNRTQHRYAEPFTDDYVRGLEEGKRHQQPSPITLARLDKIEKTIEPLPAWMQHINDALMSIKEELGSIKKDTTYTNGKVAELVAWRERLVGAKDAVKVMWVVFGALLLAGVFALFNMWAQMQQLDAKINGAVADSFENYLEVKGYSPN